MNKNCAKWCIAALAAILLGMMAYAALVDDPDNAWIYWTMAAVGVAALASNIASIDDDE